MRTSYIVVSLACLMSVSCKPHPSCPDSIEIFLRKPVSSTDLALACKTNADSIRSLYTVALQSGNNILAETAISSLEINGAIRPDDYQEIAYYFFEKDEWDKASTYFEKSLKSDGNDNLVRLSYAIALQKKNDISGALKQYLILRNNLRSVRRTSKLENGRFVAHDDMNSSIKYESLVRHADLLILMKRYSEAEQLANEAVEYFSNGGDAYYLQGILLSHQAGCLRASDQINALLQKAQEYEMSYLSNNYKGC